MASAKTLAGPLQLAAAAATLYTGVSGSIIRYIQVSNPGASDRTFTLSIGADAASTRIFDAYPILAGHVLTFPVLIPLAAGTIVQGFASAAGAVVILLTGEG